MECLSCGFQMHVSARRAEQKLQCPRCQEQLERQAVKILFAAPAPSGEEEVHRAQPTGPEIPFVCPFCGEAYQVSAELAGKKINCRNCREPCRVGKPADTPAETHAGNFWLGVVVGFVLATVMVLVLKKLGVI